MLDVHNRSRADGEHPPTEPLFRSMADEFCTVLIEIDYAFALICASDEAAYADVFGKVKVGDRRNA